MGVPIVKEHTVPILITAALPANQGVCLFPLCRCHAVKGTVLPALYGRQSFILVLSHVSSVSLLPFSPKEFPALARSPQLRDILSRSGSLRCFPCRGIPFRTVIHFSRCSSSMNYPKSTPKRPPVPYIHKVGNQPENSLFPRSRNCGRIKIVIQQSQNDRSENYEY